MLLGTPPLSNHTHDHPVSTGHIWQYAGEGPQHVSLTLGSSYRGSGSTKTQAPCLLKSKCSRESLRPGPRPMANRECTGWELHLLGGTEMLSIRAGVRAGSECQMLSPSQQGHRDTAAGLPRAGPTQTREEGTAVEHTKRSTSCQRTAADILHTCGTMKHSQLGIFHTKDTSNNILQL